MKCGIYYIYCIENEKGYVGSSYDIEGRFCNHKSNLRNNKHKNNHLQNAYNKYGKEKFEFSILKLCERNELVEQEQFYKDSNLINSDFNIRVKCVNNYGLRWI